MGLFGNDTEQDERLDAMEAFVRALAEAVHQNQLDSISLGVALIRMEAQISGKVAAADVDPGLVEFNEQLGVAREEAKKAAEAASDSWAALQAGATDALATLRVSADEAKARIEREIGN
jgi:hypothetical protein